MAYTKSPTQDTYSSEDIDITKEIVSRQGGLDKDEDYVNVFMEPIKNKPTSDQRNFVMKRAGSTGLLASVVSGTIRGSAYWEDQQKLFYCVGTNMYVYNFALATSTTIALSPFTSTGTVGFAEYIYNSGVTSMIVSDGTTLLQIDASNAVTYCVDADLPVPHDPNIVFIDGYILAVKVGTGDMYNSDNNAPLSWTPGNLIDAEIEADTIVRLFKVSNYIVAAGKETLEYFWDAAVATGSPFQRNDTPVKRISYLAAAAQEQNMTYFIGKELNSDYQVYKLYDFKCEAVGTPMMSRYLNTLGTNYNTWIGNVVAYQGHRFYVVNAGTKTYAMDLDTGLWTRLAYQGTGTFNMARAHGFRSATSNTTIFALNDGSSAWYQFNETLYQDNGVAFNSIIITDSNDFGTLNRKNMHRLTFYADQPPTDSNMLVQWTDDDYQSFNTGIVLNMNQELPCVRQLGNFRQRAFKFTFSANTPLRIQRLVADINKGST